MIKKLIIKLDINIKVIKSETNCTFLFINEHVEHEKHEQWRIVVKKIFNFK